MNQSNFPNDTYRPAPSKIKTVSLYQKILDDSHTVYNKEGEDQTEELHCPQCDAPIRFAPVDGLTCDHCGFREQRESKPISKPTSEVLSTELLTTLAHGWGTPRRTLRCQRCQSNSSVAVSTTAYNCPYCLSNRVVETLEENDLLRPSKMLPFQLSLEAAQNKVAEWAKSVPFVSKQFQQRVVQDIHPLYVPVWLFSLTAVCRWQLAQPENQPAPTRGAERYQLANVMISASSQISELPEQKAHRLPDRPFIAFQPDFLAGIPTLLPDLALADGWRETRQQIGNYATTELNRTVRENGRIPHTNISISYQNERWAYALFPVYLSTYSYEGEQYQIILNGIDGTINNSFPITSLINTSVGTSSNTRNKAIRTPIPNAILANLLPATLMGLTLFTHLLHLTNGISIWWSMITAIFTYGALLVMHEKWRTQIKLTDSHIHVAAIAYFFFFLIRSNVVLALLNMLILLLLVYLGLIQAEYTFDYLQSWAEKAIKQPHFNQIVEDEE